MKSSRLAFTLVEMIVVLSVVLGLTALTLSGVQYAREAARRTSCQNMMRNVSIAIANAEAARRVYPSVVSGFEKKGTRGAIVELLPYLELSGNFTRLGLFEECGPAFDKRNQSLPLRCPSDPAESGSNVRFNSGSSIYFQNDPRIEESTGNGAFPGVEPLRSSDFQDGLTFTSAISERPIGRDNDSSSSSSLGYMSGWFGMSTAQVTDGGILIPGAIGFYSGRSVLHGNFKHLGYNHAMLPNAKQMDMLLCGTAICGYCTIGMIAPRSYHNGGLNVVSMDGHVSFVSNSIEKSTWRALGTRAGAESMTPE